MNLKELAESRVVIDADICGGKPRIRGSRVAIADILLALAEGMSHQEILRNFRSLQPKDIQAALAYCFCITDGVKLIIGSSFGSNQQIGSGRAVLTKDEIEREENDVFSKALAQQASIQEEITQEKVQQIKAKKIAKNKAPQVEQKLPPRERPYDLLIDISSESSTKIFHNEASAEQGVDMSFDNYLFEERVDGKPWLTYSSKDGVEIDQAMKRNLLVTYIGIDGSLKEAVFEGYLTTDRQHKIFIQKTHEGKVCGRAL
jgi:uncharacterized protein (DUF433 family)